MRHVDEGLLHAWIDGAFEAGTPEREEIEAHLAGCADCRVRLEDARRVRDVAQDVLAAASTSVAPAPPWDAIVAEHASRRRAGGGAAPGPVPSRAPRPRIPLAWAASLILAVGAGWMGRAMLAERGSSPAQQEMLESADAFGDLDAAALRREAAPASGEVASAVSEAPPPSAEARRDATAEPSAPAPQVEDTRLRSTVVTPQAAPLRRSADEQVAAAKASAPASANLGRAFAADAVAGITTMAAAPLASAADSLAGRWVAADSQAVSDALGTAPLAVAGLTPDSVQLGTLDGAPIARSIFVLDDAVVEVLQRPVAFDDEAPAAREAESIVAQSAFILRGIEVLVRGTSAAAVDDLRSRLR